MQMYRNLTEYLILSLGIQAIYAQVSGAHSIFGYLPRKHQFSVPSATLYMYVKAVTDKTEGSFHQGWILTLVSRHFPIWDSPTSCNSLQKAYHALESNWKCQNWFHRNNQYATVWCYIPQLPHSSQGQGEENMQQFSNSPLLTHTANGKENSWHEMFGNSHDINSGCHDFEYI